MTRHPSTEGNDLEPARVDAKEEVTVPDPDGDGRVKLAGIQVDVQEDIEAAKQEARQVARKSFEGLLPGYLG